MQRNAKRDDRQDVGLEVAALVEQSAERHKAGRNVEIASTSQR
jgi:hypothetical protein